MLYWVTADRPRRRRGCTARRCAPARFAPRGFRVEVPTGCAIFPKEIVEPPRAWVERSTTSALDADAARRPLRRDGGAGGAGRRRPRLLPRRCASVPRFTRHAVCSPLTLASRIGLDVLRDGGNSADAAIATNLALAVAYPHMCGVGGDLLAMVWRDGTLVGLNSSGRLPAAASLPADGVPQRGAGSATVPGARPAGWRWRIGSPAGRSAHSPSPRSVSRATGWSARPAWPSLTAWSATCCAPIRRPRASSSPPVRCDSPSWRRRSPRSPTSIAVPWRTRRRTPSRRRISRRIARNG